MCQLRLLMNLSYDDDQVNPQAKAVFDEIKGNYQLGVFLQPERQAKRRSLLRPCLSALLAFVN